MVDAATVMIVRELLNKLRLVVGLMVVGLNSFPRSAQLLPTGVITTTYINSILFNFQPFKLCVLIEIFVRAPVISNKLENGKLNILENIYLLTPLAPPVSRKPLAKGLWSILSWVTFSF